MYKSLAETIESKADPTASNKKLIQYAKENKKLEDLEKDDYSLGSTGILVTARSRKNRIAKPKKIKFSIDHDKGCNKYEGLEFFCTPVHSKPLSMAEKINQPVAVIFS